MAGSVYEGKTFDEAVRKGLEALRLTRAEAVITTVEEGKGGFLGLGSRPFRVSVARRPGGAIKEPVEREDRGARRGGPPERGGRGGRSGPDRGGNRGGERPARAGRDEKPAAREERPAREPGGGRGRRDERPAREERAPREERAAREPQANREERAPREERRPAPAASAPVPPAVAADDGDDSPRKRRRRGRRGGRGRRRGGPGGEGEHAGAPEMAGMRREAATAPPVNEAAPMAPVAMTPPEPPRPAPMHMEPVRSEPVRVEPVAPAASPVEAEAYAGASASHEERAPREEHAPREERAPRRERPAREERGERRSGSESSPELSGDDLIATSRKITEELLRAMGFEPKVQVRADGDRVDVTVEVERDGDLLNGRQGETRQALQHLLNRFLNRGDGSRYHLQLEVNDFWQRREVELADLAKQMAEDAVTRNAEVVTGYLNSQERRMIHVTLKEDARVRTFSLGDGMLKRVAVAPASFPERTEDASAS